MRQKNLQSSLYAQFLFIVSYLKQQKHLYEALFALFAQKYQEKSAALISVIAGEFSCALAFEPSGARGFCPAHATSS